MSHKNPADQILAIGVALKKGLLKELEITIPSYPGYALFRHYGLQVIPNESLEIDTGGSDVVIFTPQANIVSGVLLKITSALSSHTQCSELTALIKEAGEILRKAHTSNTSDWVTLALGKVISLALDFASRLKPRTRGTGTHTAPRDPSTVRHDLGDEVSDYLENMKEFSVSFGWPSMARQRAQQKNDKAAVPPILIICKMPGRVVGKEWLPLPRPGFKLTRGLLNRICIEVAERGLDPSYAQLILGELLARSLGQK